MMYVPFSQAPFWGGALVVRQSVSTTESAAGLRRIVNSIDPDLPVSEVMTMQDVVSESAAQPKLRTALLSGLGIMALLLAALGVFGVLSYSVASRVREFGVRVALGATPGVIAKAVLREGLLIGATGLLFGLAAAAGVVRLLSTELYKVPVFDPVTFMASSAMFLLLAMLSCYVPARRAMNVDPAVALRIDN